MIYYMKIFHLRFPSRQNLIKIMDQIESTISSARGPTEILFFQLGLR